MPTKSNQVTLIDREAPLPVVKQCQSLTVSRSSVYYQKAAVSDEKLFIMQHIGEIHLARPFLGSRRISDALRDRGLTVNHKRVQRLMRLMGLRQVVSIRLSCRDV